MSLSCKIMSLRFLNINLCFVILTLCFFSITFLTGSIFGISLSSNSSNVSALTYSTEEDISFTFAPSLSITLSDTDLVIDTLAPGNTAESNTITVSVASNTPYGYALYADAGSSDTSSKYYNTSDLIRSDNINAVFTSIATNASLPTLATDNTWGYSTSKDNGTTWSVYNGLPTATSTDGSTSTSNPAVLIDTKLPADSQSIALKVAARSSATQASGAYGNIINFYAVGKPAPPTIDDIEYMQEFASSSESIKDSMPEHITYTLKDSRDEREYTIAKLKDGKVWMTQNLDLAGGTNIYSEDSDVSNRCSKLDDYPCFTLPNSSVKGFDNNFTAFVYNVPYDQINRTDCSSGPCYSYYSYRAATASSGSSNAADNTDAQYSICPKGWKLPNSRNTDDPNWQSADFYKLAVAYGMNPNSTSSDGSDFLNQAGPGTVPNFVYSGYCDNFDNYNKKGCTQRGESLYWSSTALYYGGAQALSIDGRYHSVYTSGGWYRATGAAVRCLAR